MENATHVKEEARRLVEELPENVSWADFARLVLERQRVEEGLNEHVHRDLICIGAVRVAETAAQW